MASQFLSLTEARNWLHLYDNQTEEDKEIDNTISFLIDFSEGYVLDAVGPWILDTQEETVVSKVKFLMRALIKDLYDARAFSSQVALSKTERVNYLITSTITQLTALNPDLNSNYKHTFDIWEYL